MNKLLKLKSTLLTVIFATALAASPSLSWALDDAMVKQTTPSGIEYIFGGVGEDRQKEMEEVRKDYIYDSLLLTRAVENISEMLM